MPANATKIAQPAPSIDVIVDAECWSAQPEAESVIRRAIEAAMGSENRPGEVAVMLTDDESIRQLNAQWRGLDKPTNVLSFPSGEAAAMTGQVHLGDIAIAFETVAREAEAENKAFADHLAHLAVHGYLHLIGFDHETDSEADQMESLEVRILSSLGIADPYADRNSAD